MSATVSPCPFRLLLGVGLDLLACRMLLYGVLVATVEARLSNDGRTGLPTPVSILLGVPYHRLAIPFDSDERASTNPRWTAAIPAEILEVTLLRGDNTSSRLLNGFWASNLAKTSRSFDASCGGSKESNSLFDFQSSGVRMTFLGSMFNRGPVQVVTGANFHINSITSAAADRTFTDSSRSKGCSKLDPLRRHSSSVFFALHPASFSKPTLEFWASFALLAVRISAPWRSEDGLAGRKAYQWRKMSFGYCCTTFFKRRREASREARKFRKTLLCWDP
mmetsp:Transcript_3064/g.7151  ORF Transcript_3064/g.7151 Transcript_3064/m.7151 type:complete len:277 (-) Transcript_3064:703-1533(-)